MSSTGPAYLGVDLGTSGLKLTLLAGDGSVLAEAEAPFGVRSSTAAEAEISPRVWEAALRRAARDLAGKVSSTAGSHNLAAVGVTGQMHGVVLVGADGAPVRPAILWPDQRATGLLTSWASLPADARACLANPLVAGMPGPMLSWLHRHEPQSLASAALVTFPKDWLRGLQTGDRESERSDASATLLWDMAANDWCEAALELAGVARPQLPHLGKSCEVVGETGWWAQFEGLSGKAGRRAPVVAGGADAACALAALQATQPSPHWPDTVVINLGTGVQLLRPRGSVSKRPEPLTHLYADTNGGWYEMLAIQNGGFALAWVQSMLGMDWDEFVTMAMSAAPGAAGATFVPFLMGERGAVAPPGSSAGWSGLTRSVGRAELARSAFEALAFSIRRGVDLLGEHAGPLLLSGGGGRDPRVRQLIADVLGRPLSYVQLRSASAVGAAMLAARGVGAHLPVPAEVVEVVPAPSPTQDDAFARWTSVVEAAPPL